LHLSAWDEGEPLAYLRVLPPGVHPSGCPSLGRVCTTMEARRKGLGRELMKRGLELVRAQWPGHDCQIGAQAYLRQFYESFGFVVNGEEYEEDGIMHFPMRRYWR
jgi:ElaA protein